MKTFWRCVLRMLRFQLAYTSSFHQPRPQKSHYINDLPKYPKCELSHKGACGPRLSHWCGTWFLPCENTLPHKCFHTRCSCCSLTVIVGARFHNTIRRSQQSCHVLSVFLKDKIGHSVHRYWLGMERGFVYMVNSSNSGHQKVWRLRVRGTMKCAEITVLGDCVPNPCLGCGCLWNNSTCAFVADWTTWASLLPQALAELEKALGSCRCRYK